jgi:hypothetical protein
MRREREEQMSPNTGEKNGGNIEKYLQVVRTEKIVGSLHSQQICEMSINRLQYIHDVCSSGSVEHYKAGASSE